MIIISKQLEQNLAMRLSVIYRGMVWGKKKRFCSVAIDQMLALSDDEIRKAMEVNIDIEMS